LLVVHPLVDDEGAVADISLELWAARQELDFFGKALGMPVQLVEGPSLPEAMEEVPPAEGTSSAEAARRGGLPGESGDESASWLEAQAKVKEARRILTENSGD